MISGSNAWKRRPPRNPTAKLPVEAIREIVRNPSAKTIAEWATEMRCAHETIRRLVCGESWRHIDPEITRTPARRAPRLTIDEIARIRSLARKNIGSAEIARHVGKPRSTVWRVIRMKTHREIY